MGRAERWWSPCHPSDDWPPQDVNCSAKLGRSTTLTTPGWADCPHGGARRRRPPADRRAGPRPARRAGAGGACVPPGAPSRPASTSPGPWRDHRLRPRHRSRRPRLHRVGLHHDRDRTGRLPGIRPPRGHPRGHRAQSTTGQGDPRAGGGPHQRAPVAPLNRIPRRPASPAPPPPSPWPPRSYRVLPLVESAGGELGTPRTANRAGSTRVTRLAGQRPARSGRP